MGTNRARVDVKGGGQMIGSDRAWIEPIGTGSSVSWQSRLLFCSV